MVDMDMARAVRAGLLLRAERFEDSHSICQEIKSREGSYWHGILHRREPDAPNARYWFQRVGSHPILETLAAPPRGSLVVAQEALQWVAPHGRWDLLRFVDLCVAVALEGKDSPTVGGPDPTVEQLEELQEWELRSLLGHCFLGALRTPGRLKRFS